jgi:transcriptional/translational regulatory protein YebC/TACO1
VAYLFSEVGQLSFPAGSDENRIIEAALEAGAEDVVNNDDGSMDVLTDPHAFTRVREAMKKQRLDPEHAEVTMRPSTGVSLDAGDAERMVTLLETLEDLDDVQQVYSNADISEEILERIA